MAAKIFRINYKSDFILTLNSDAGWMTPFCIKFWTGAPSQAFFVGWDGETYTHCAPVAGEPTKLLVQFDDHHLPIGDLKFQIAYHFTVADFPNDTEDEVINPASITTEIDGETYQVMLDFTGETAPEIEFSLPAYANEVQRIENEQQRIDNEEQRVADEQTRISNEQTRVAQEQTRQQNEAQRIAQESARVSEFASLKSASEAATRDANNAATLANEKAQLADDKAALADSAATQASLNAVYAHDEGQLAGQKAIEAAQATQLATNEAAFAHNQGNYAKNQGDYAKEQGDTALADHVRANVDHSTAVDDHTQANNDHTRSESDHSTAAADHTTAGNDHTRAESDHGIAADDHTQAGNDHTRAESDNGIAAADHTQAGNDHTRAESDHTRAESDHAAVEVYVDSLGAFDISAYHATGGVLAEYADLTAALGTNGANIPDALRKGGMSVKFVSSSDHKYVQYRLMSDTFNTTPANWQGVDDEPTAGSENLAKSGGIWDLTKEVVGVNTHEEQETGYLPVTIRSRWNGSATPSLSNARARCTNVIEKTESMFKIVVGSSYLLVNVYGSNDGATYITLTDGTQTTEFNISDKNYKYLTVDIKKADSSNFDDQDDVSHAIGIFETVTVETLRELGNEVGLLSGLQTENKTTVVSAINEVNTKNEGIVDAVKETQDAIGYDVVGELSRDVELTPRKAFSPYIPGIQNAVKQAYGEFIKDKDDIYVNLAAKGSNVYYLGAIYYSTDNWQTFTKYADTTTPPFITDETKWNISMIPNNASVIVNIYKPEHAEFSVDEDLIDVMTVISNELSLRKVNYTDSPKDVLGVLLNNARLNNQTLHIKLLGDSITHGVGSSDWNGAVVKEQPVSYDFSVQLLGATWYVTRSTGVKSWAAKFASYMGDKYGAVVVNNGVSMGDSQMIIDSWDNLVSNTDDLIICMIGTNDRTKYNDQQLIENFRGRMETIQHKADIMGIPILFMSIIPVSLYYETHGADGVEHTYTMHAEDVENVVHLVSKSEDKGYVPMYTDFLDYAKYRNIDFTTLLNDNLHPNDDGNTLMYDILLRHVGLGRKIPGATW